MARDEKWAADGITEIVVAERRNRFCRGVQKKVVGVQGIVSKIVVGVAMKLLRNGEKVGATCSSVLGAVIACKNLEFG
jgi:hypothetical protein